LIRFVFAAGSDIYFRSLGYTHRCFLNRRNILGLRRYPNRFIILAGILIIAIVACSREDNFIGTYKSISGSGSGNPPEFANLYLELKKDGEGIRRINGNNFPFRWVVKDHQIRIHTTSGGTIVGHIWWDFLVLRFPGPLVIYLRKIK
jgi:hypothetical protein